MAHDPVLSLPSSFDAARTAFVEAAQGAGAILRRYDLAQTRANTTPLSTDTALLGSPSAKRLIIVTSGIHGVEGYAGSACQTRFLARAARTPLPPDLAIVLVHAINPWGFAHDSRVTEEGVDMNRNFVDFPCAPAARAAYAPFHHVLVEDYRPLPAGWRNFLALLRHGVTAAQRRALQNAVTAGQYARADGMFFGGFGPTRSRHLWEQIVEDHVPGRAQAFLLDLHTGLGAWGEGELMCDLPKSSPLFRQMADWFGGRIRSMADGESVSAALQGTMTAAFMRGDPLRRHAIGLEFGTLPGLAVLNALRADQWQRNHRDTLSSREREWVRQRMKRAFAPDAPQWAEKVVARFDEVMTQLIAGLGSATLRQEDSVGAA